MEYMGKYYGFDTENDEKGIVTLTALYSEDDESWVWHSAGGFRQWADKQHDSPMVCCHNLEYDLRNEFGDDFPYLSLVYLKGNLVSAKYGNVSFRDSVLHFKMSLAALGDSIGIKKLAYDINSPEYVTIDAKICCMAMVGARDFIASLGGKMGATAGSSAVSVWRAMTEDEYVTGALDSEWLRAGYYGGRTELFASHMSGEINAYDVNSIYPYSMLKEYPESVQLDSKMVKSKGMAEVTIAIPTSLYIAPLPYRTGEKSITFPVGRIRGVWTYDEIRFAEKQGAKILTIHKALGGNSLVRPFTDYVETLYEKRRITKSPSEKLFLKVLMNSLYGKMAGGKNGTTRTVSRAKLEKANDPRILQVDWIDANRGLLDYPARPEAYVNVIWGSMITSYSRILLASFLYQVPEGKLIYSDTDSIYCEGFKFPTGDGIGKLKLEMTCQEMKCVQPKVYGLGTQTLGAAGEPEMVWEYKAKGVPKPKRSAEGAILVDYAGEYVINGATEFFAPLRFRESLRTTRAKHNQWIAKTRTMRTAYTKKTLRDNLYSPPIIAEQTELFPSNAEGDNTQTPKKKR